MPSPLIQLEANLIRLGSVRSLAQTFGGSQDVQLAAFVGAQLEVSRQILVQATPRTDESLPNNELRNYSERPHMADMYHVRMTSDRSGYIENESEHALMVAVTGAKPHQIPPHGPSDSPWLHFFLGANPKTKSGPNLPFDEVFYNDVVDHPGMERSKSLYDATLAEAVRIRQMWATWGARMGVSITRDLARNASGQFI